MLLEGFFALICNIILFSSKIDTKNAFPHPLSPEMEKEYLQKFKENNDLEARNILIKHNLRLVVYIAKKYVNYPDNEDLIGVGSMGLVKAINSFNPLKGSNLATYASRCIENEILMTMRIHKKHSKNISIFDTVGRDKDGNEMTLLDSLYINEEDMYAKSDESFVAKSIFNLIAENLTEREKTIINYRYGLNGEEPLTQQKVADKLGLSRSYISRIEKKTLSKLKKIIKDKNLDF